MGKKNKEYSYIQPEVDKRRKKKKKKAKKSGGFGKILLVIIALVVLLIAGAILCLRFVFTDFYFSNVLPSNDVAAFVDESIIGRTITTQATVPVQTTTQPTTLSSVSYLEHSDFDFSGAKKGGFVGNILNGGRVDRDNGVVYHLVDGRGIYKFTPDTESFSLVYKSTDTLSSFNIRGDYFYFVNNTDNALYKVTKTGKNLQKVADSVSYTYIYDTTAYCVSPANELKVVDTQSFTSRVLYSGYGDKVSLVGISLDRVFFTSEDSLGNTSYLCILTTGGDEEHFKVDTKNGDVSAMTMENGFMYYYQKQADGTYSIIRQKYGSQKTVTLVEDVHINKPVIVDHNKLFYADLDGDKLKMFELNMNNDTTKMMLYSGNVSSSDNVFIQHGGEYDFIIGQRLNGDKIYRASSNLTGSSNVMTFSDGAWNY